MDVISGLEGFARPTRESLADQVATILKQFILAEGLDAGARMPAERHLANTLNVSRTVLREAQSRLIGEGLLERPSPRVLQVATHDRETLAASLTPADERATKFLDMMELRYILEMGALPVIITRLTPESLAGIERWAQEYERRVLGGETAPGMDVRFHTALLRAIGNPIIDSFLPLIEDQIRQYLLIDPGQLHARRRDATERVLREHREIVEALRSRDTAAAREAMERHLSPYFAALRGTERDTRTTRDVGSRSG